MPGKTVEIPPKRFTPKVLRPTFPKKGFKTPGLNRRKPLKGKSGRIN